MEPLDPELSHLVLAERSEVEPSAGDRERVARSLGARVGVGLGLGLGLLSTPAAGAAVASSGLGLALKLSLALAVVGSAAVATLPAWQGKPAPAAASMPSAALTGAVQQPKPEPARENPEPSAVEASPASDEPTPGKASSQGPARALPPLAEEARLLKQAQQALQSGKAGAALAALAEHQRRFPQGQLGLERSAARITALCALGQKPQAEREAKAFLARHSGSGLAAQVRASCGASATH